MSKPDFSEAKKLHENTECIFDKKVVEAAISKVAEQMNEVLADKMPVLLCVMNGAVIFMVQLTTQLNFPLLIDYIHVTRYQGGIEGREIHWVAEPNIDLKDRVVVVIEDILDGGLTLSAVKNFCLEQGVSEFFSATLINKERPREEGGLEKCDFVGLNIEDKFLIGYGLDFQGFFRNDPGIYVVNTD